ncbi:MAG: hypothetical protein PHC64_10645, partial [Candidatus Gastranaerophilales bacterium]|nr:hypothetical protein [Candidatus Gastranaerophilales bacterium]
MSLNNSISSILYIPTFNYGESRALPLAGRLVEGLLQNALALQDACMEFPLFSSNIENQQCAGIINNLMNEIAITNQQLNSLWQLPPPMPYNGMNCPIIPMPQAPMPQAADSFPWFLFNLPAPAEQQQI